MSSPQAVDTVTEIYSQKSPCKVIGVDVAQEDSDIGRYVSQSKFQEDKGQKIILCSAEKDMAYMTPLLLQNSATNSRAC